MLALFVALGGSAFAAKSYVITSASQIKPSVIDNLQGDRGPRGAKGPTGPQGPTGPTGPTGASASLATIVEVLGDRVTIAPNDAEASAATCPAGSRVVSGGGAALTGDANGLSVSEASEDRQSWLAVAGNTSVISGSVRAFAYCTPSGVAVASRSAGAAHKRAEQEADALAKQLTQQLQAG